MHRTQPVQMIKLLMSFPDSAQMTKLSYKHIVLASHSRVEGLDDRETMWFVTAIGCWRDPDSLKQPGTSSRTDAAYMQAPSVRMTRFKRQTDVAYVLPC